MIGGGRLLLLEIWVKLAALEPNRRFSIYFRSWRLNSNTWQKSSINTNEPKMNIVRCLKAPQRVAQKRQCPKF